MSATILVLGRSGQLARALAACAIPGGGRILSLGRDALDLRRIDAIAPALAAARPDAIINAAAYTAVDQAEDDEAGAYALNCDAPATVAAWCAQARVPLVHLSTDYVFDGRKGAPYVETDAIAPLNVYGRSKAEGEARVLDSGAAAAVVRASWVYRRGHSNFVTAMLKLAETRDTIEVVADQAGNPTYAPDLAAVCVGAALRLVAGDAAVRGIVHAANAGGVNRADFAETIFAEARARGLRGAEVVRVTTASRSSRAQRPLDSRFDLTRATELLGPMRDWRAGLRDFFDAP